MGVRGAPAPRTRMLWAGGGVCVSSTCAQAERRNRQKPGPGEPEARSPVRAHPPREALPPNEGPRGGEDGCARTGPSPPTSPFCFLGTMGESNGQTREHGWRGQNEPGAGTGDRAEAGSKGRLWPCHRDSPAGPALSGRTGGGGGAEAGAGLTAATLELTLSASLPRPPPPPTACHNPPGSPPQKPRGAHRAAESNCNGEKRRRSRGRAGGRALGRCGAT